MAGRIIAYKSSVYIEPISACNMNCRMCYANASNGRDMKIISASSLVSFVGKFAEHVKRNFSIYWCGTGEVFLHPYFPDVINRLNETYNERISHTIMTNGTIDRLDEFKAMGNTDFLVSIDGPKEHHEWNRGAGTYEKPVNFCKKALEKGCSDLHVRTLITKDNIENLLEFESDLKQEFGRKPKILITIPYRREELSPVDSSTIRKQPDDSRMLLPDEAEILLKEMYGNKFKGLFESMQYSSAVELSLMPDSNVYSCCEGIVQIGSIEMPIKELLSNLAKSKEKCLSCSLYGNC